MIHRVYRVFQDYFRPERMRRFCAGFGVGDATLILDVGGTEQNWGYVAEVSPRLVIGNLFPPKAESDRVETLAFDGAALPFADRSFDVVYSNSVIEHVGKEKLGRFAEEIRRVGKSYYVQTPNKWFFVEPHFLCVFIHWLPRAWYRKVVPYLSAWAWIRKPSAEAVARHFDEIELLDEARMRALFPDAEIVREKFLFMTKSLIAMRV